MELSDLSNRPKVKKKENTSQDYSHEELIASIFLISFNYSYRIIEKIIDDFFRKMETEFGIIKNPSHLQKYNRMIKNKLVQSVVNDLYWQINRDRDLNDKIREIEAYYEDASNSKFKMMDDLYYTILSSYIKKYLQAIQIFSLTSISNKKLKMEKMKSLGIKIEPYKPAGSKVNRDHRMIYFQIPIQLMELESQFGKNKRGKSDNKAAVYKAIDFLEIKKVIKKYKYDPEKIYDNWKKRKPKNL